MTTPSFPWQPDGGSQRETIACLNFGGELGLYQAGFRDGAEVLMEALERQKHGQDLLVYPLVYCLRHSVELALKMVIRDARLLLDKPGSFPDGHRLHDLWNTARPLLEEIWKNDRKAFDRIAGVIDDLRSMDPEGEGFRYPVTTKNAKGNPRAPTIDPTLRHLDLRKLYDDVVEVLDLLEAGDSGIDAHAEYKAEMEAERRQYLDEIAAENREYYSDDY